VFRFGPFHLDPVQGLTLGTTSVHLTPKSLALLSLLARRAGQVVTKAELFAAVWPDTAVSDAALTSCIQELRTALEDDARQPRYIETVHRRGFRFVANVTLPETRPAPPVETAAAGVVGRESVLASMGEALSRARTGRRQVVLVTGPPGIGKSAVVNAFLQSTLIADASVTGAGCVEHHGPPEVYGALLEALTRLARSPDGPRVIATLAQCAPTWLAHMPAVQSPAQYADLQRRTAGTTRDRMLRELNDAIDQLASAIPLVIWLEDLHWADAATLDWLVAFAARSDPARVLLIGTWRRREFQPGGDAIDDVGSDLRLKGLCHELALSGLDEASFTSLVLARYPPAGEGRSLARVARQVWSRTDGNPLFGMNVLADLAARGVLVEREGRWHTVDESEPLVFALPDDVRRVIERQHERLVPEHLEALEAASVVGLRFSAAAVAAALGKDVADVEAMLASMARQTRFIAEAGAETWPDGSVSGLFGFAHSLYREVVYARIPAGRRADLHRRVGLRLEAAFGDRAPDLATDLAAHFEYGGERRRAVLYLRHAAATAVRRSATLQAAEMFARALALLANLPPSDERDELEIALRVGRGAVLMATRGWGAPEVEDMYARARALSEQFGDTPQLFRATWGLWLFYWGRGSMDGAAQLADRLLAMAGRSGDRELLLQAHHALWATSFSKGEISRAHEHAAAGSALYEQERHFALVAAYGNHDAAVCARAFDARALALLGYDAEAVHAAESGIALARRLGHPFSLTLALVFAAAVHQFRGAHPEALRHAAEASALGRAHSFPLLLAWALVFEGWADVRAGRTTQGLDRIAAGLEKAEATGSDQFRPHLLGVAADAHLHAGGLVEARRCVDRAFELAARTGERFYESELHRLDAELRLAAGDGGDAGEALKRAIEMAARQGATLFAERSAARLRQLPSARP
jgi:DNA-binding winged helix-turn-helix (wHTH) protein/predicted ATPase